MTRKERGRTAEYSSRADLLKGRCRVSSFLLRGGGEGFGRFFIGISCGEAHNSDCTVREEGIRRKKKAERSRRGLHAHRAQSEKESGTATAPHDAVDNCLSQSLEPNESDADRDHVKAHLWQGMSTHLSFFFERDSLLGGVIEKRRR